MKKKFLALLKFLKPFNKTIQFVWHAPDENIEYDWGTSSNISGLPEMIFDFAIDVVEYYCNEINSELFDNCYSETEYHSVYLFVEPKTNSMYIELKYEEYINQAETYERKLENPELEEYFKRTGVEIIEARYSGGGDSGDIDSITIDGVDSNIQWNSQDDDEKLIWDTLYDNLENAYGGWEIDDGSAGTIELNNNLEIVISHEWNMKEMNWCGEKFELTVDMFED